jgi:hypothetical protein
VSSTTSHSYRFHNSCCRCSGAGSSSTAGTARIPQQRRP